MTRWLEASIRLTVVFLVTSVVLIVPGTLGVGAGIPLVIVLAGLAIGGFAVRDAVARGRPRLGIPVGHYLAVAWIGPVVAVGLVVAAFGASPAEVQALGGLAGLVAMLNYFLRPVYYAVVAAGRRVVGAL